MKSCNKFWLLLLSCSLVPISPLFSQTLLSKLEIYHVDSGERKVVYEEIGHFEAPNWSPDGQYLIINSNGKLFKVDLTSGGKEMIDTGFADKCNNDHGISPDGQQLVISHYDQPNVPYEDRDFKTSRIYTLPITGGVPQVVTSATPSFWHGWSPDGSTLLYTALRDDDFDIYAIPVQGGAETRLTSSPGLDDGADYSPDGQHIYFNSMASGKMEIWRMRSDGSKKEQLTNDAYSNWFPHPSPDGESVVVLSYLEDQGDRHPAMKEVALRLMDIEGGATRELMRFTGGQGTINVPSWSPGGEWFAFVSYAYVEASPFDDSRLYVLTDGDMPASGYIDGELDADNRYSEDNLSIWEINEGQIALTSSIAVSNSVRRWPNSATLRAIESRKYVLVAEQDGKAPAGAIRLEDIGKAQLLTLINVTDPSNPTVADTLVFENVPACVAFHPTRELFALTFLGSDSIAFGTIIDDQLKVLSYSRINISGETISAIPHFTWHPNGQFAAITLAGNDKLQFLKYEHAESPTLSLWGDALKTAPLPGVGYFDARGQWFALTSINLTSDLEQSAYRDNASLLSIYRFDDTEKPDSPPTRRNDGSANFTSPAVKHTKTAQLSFGQGYVETFAISPDNRFIVGLNMRGSWLPEGKEGKTRVSALELFKFDDSTGKAVHLQSLPFESILPESITFDPSGSSLIVASFDHHGPREGDGSILFFRLLKDAAEPRLVPSGQRYYPRGIHQVLVD